jgi:hypothetical protein
VHRHVPPATPTPRFVFAILRVLLPRAERDELLADVRAELAERSAAHGEAAARRWLWWQTLRSAPALLGWSWWRERTGFEPVANTYRPGGPMLQTWIADARYAVRRLRARPTYSLLAVLTLALGIGGTTAVFGIARPLLLDPLPYANADQVVTFWMGGWWTEEEYLFLRDKFSGFVAVGAQRPGDVTMREGGSRADRSPRSCSTCSALDRCWADRSARATTCRARSRSPSSATGSGRSSAASSR